MPSADTYAEGVFSDVACAKLKGTLDFRCNKSTAKHLLYSRFSKWISKGT